MGVGIGMRWGGRGGLDKDGMGGVGSWRGGRVEGRT